jgi:ATP-dependent helicase YprA (DUF1998 family)
MEYVAVASTLLSAAQSIQQARAQETMFDLRSKQSLVEAEAKALAYERRANDGLRRVVAANAALAARNKGMFSNGMFQTLAATNLRNAGIDISRDMQNAKLALQSGQTRSAMDQIAADQAATGGYLSAAAKLGTSAYELNKEGAFEKIGKDIGIV